MLLILLSPRLAFRFGVLGSGFCLEWSLQGLLQSVVGDIMPVVALD